MCCFSASTFERLASRLRWRCRKLPSADLYALLSSGPAGCRPAATRPSSTHRAVVASTADAEHPPVGRRVNGVGHGRPSSRDRRHVRSDCDFAHFRFPRSRTTYKARGCGGFNEQDNSQHPNCHAVRQRLRSGGPWSRRRAGRTQEAGGRLAIALTVALFGATTAAAAISASGRNCASVPKLWQQNPPSILMKLPGYYGPDEALF